MKALIVDDEAHSRDNLSHMLQIHCAQIDHIEKVSSVDLAVEVLASYKPDVIFLDIEMPGKDGFQLLKEYDTSQISVVFVTAYDAYAIRAIRFSPAGYVLKPIDPKELYDAVVVSNDKINVQKASASSYNESIAELTEVYAGKKEVQRICLSHTSKLELINLTDIVYLSADSYYTTFHLNSKRKIVMSKTMKYYQQILPDNFIRVHRSYLVNLSYIETLHLEAATLELRGEIRVPVSRRKTHEVVDKLKQIS